MDLAVPPPPRLAHVAPHPYPPHPTSDRQTKRLQAPSHKPQVSIQPSPASLDLGSSGLHTPLEARTGRITKTPAAVVWVISDKEGEMDLAVPPPPRLAHVALIHSTVLLGSRTLSQTHNLRVRGNDPHYHCSGDTAPCVKILLSSYTRAEPFCQNCWGDVTKRPAVISPYHHCLDWLM